MTILQAGVDFPMQFQPGGVIVKATFSLRDYNGHDASGLRFYFRFVNLRDVSQYIHVPSTPMISSNGMFQIDDLEVFRFGRVKVSAFAGANLAAEGSCRYNTDNASRSGNHKLLYFDGQRNSHEASDSDLTQNDEAVTETESETAGVNGDVSAGPASVGGDFSATRGRQRRTGGLNRHGTTTPRLVPGSLMQMNQIFPEQS